MRITFGGRFGAAAVAAGLVGAIAVSGAAGAAAAPQTSLDGLFALSPGICAGGAVTGSFFRMILPTGNAGGPYLSNSDSRCSDQTVTPLAPGSDGGLLGGRYQPQPATAFDGSGNARSGSVTTPVRFYGVDFATATNPVDPQTGAAAATPRLFTAGDGRLTGDLSALGVTWNKQVFNQGSPKPGGGLSGKTSAVRGTIDSAGDFVIEWTSQIVGGPFNNFTGLWHLAGRYQGGGAMPAAAPAAAAPPGPGAAPPAPAAAAPNHDGPVAQAVPLAAEPGVPGPVAMTTKTVTVPHKSAPAWLLGVLVAVGLLGVVVFCGADRLVARRRPEFPASR